MKGKFIVLEGIDGRGKSTQAKLLEQRMINTAMRSNHPSMTPVYSTFECSDGPIGSFIRSELLTGNIKVTGSVLNDLFIVDRDDHLKNPRNGGIAKLIEEGTNVICDRYVLSSMAYTLQGVIDNPEIQPPYYRAILQDIYEKNILNLYTLSPDLTIFIDVKPTEAMNRINEARGDKSIYESEKKLERIRRAYESVINFFDQDLILTGKHVIEKRSPHIGQGKFLEYSAVTMHDQVINQNIKTVDGNRSMEDVSHDIFNLVKELF